jgi:hypothetical protein
MWQVFKAKKKQKTLKGPYIGTIGFEAKIYF